MYLFLRGQCSCCRVYVAVTGSTFRFCPPPQKKKIALRGSYGTALPVGVAVTGSICCLQGLCDVTGSMWLLQGLRGCYGVHVPLLSPRKSPCMALTGRLYLLMWQLRNLCASCRVYVMLLGLCGCCRVYVMLLGLCGCCMVYAMLLGLCGCCMVYAMLLGLCGCCMVYVILLGLCGCCRVYVMLLGLCGCCMVYVAVGVNAALALCMWRAATNRHSDEGKRIMASGR